MFALSACWGTPYKWLTRFLGHRIGDTRILRLIRKWLKAGVVEDGVITQAEEGAPQGSVILPLLANIYLHYDFDLWADQWRKDSLHSLQDINKAVNPLVMLLLD